jgi:hypothetical protein
MANKDEKVLWGELGPREKAEGSTPHCSAKRMKSPHHGLLGPLMEGRMIYLH